jgi:hypothetical protein
MAHCKPEELKDLKALLEGLRESELLKEKSLGCFYQKGKGVLHFHIKAARRYAHLWTGAKWIEVDMPSKPSLPVQQRLVHSLLQSLPSPREGRLKTK